MQPAGTPATYNSPGDGLNLKSELKKMDSCFVITLLLDFSVNWFSGSQKMDMFLKVMILWLKFLFSVKLLNVFCCIFKDFLHIHIQ